MRTLTFYYRNNQAVHIYLGDLVVRTELESKAKAVIITSKSDCIVFIMKQNDPT